MLLAASLALVVVLLLSALGIKRLHADEVTGLEYIGPAHINTTPSPDPPGLSDAEYLAYRLTGAVANLDESPIGKIGSGPSAEGYRFFYAPSFNPHICVTIWRDGDQYQMRTVVLRWHPNPTLWGKTETIPARKWNRLRTAFTKRSVTDPFNGTDAGGGIDGSSWYLQSLVSGRVTTTCVWSPVRSIGIPHFEIVTAREPQLRDFVKSSLLFLDWAGVQVPEMY
jgi:hypothetical protein